MFVVMKKQNFEFTSNLPLPVKVETGKLIGWIPVYETLEDAMEEFPDSRYAEIKYTEEVNE